MNWDQLKKLEGTNVKLRPLPLRIHKGTYLPTDDDWHVEAVRKRHSVDLKNTASNHVLYLQADNIKEFRSQNFLILRCQVKIQGRETECEPI